MNRSPQRHHQCTQNIDCETYMSRLLKRKVERPGSSTRCPPVTTTKSDKPLLPSMTSNRPFSSIQTLKPKGSMKSSTATALKATSAPPTSQVVHKELLNNSACVEVTVKTLARKRSRSHSVDGDRGEPWGKLLEKNKGDEETARLNYYDPLRTLHFLVKELQSKLKGLCPTDPNLHQLLLDMQQIVRRLPPDLLHDKKKPSGEEVRNAVGDADTVKSYNLSDSEKLQKRKTTRSTQTEGYVDEHMEHIKDKLEASTVKLEVSCRQMETACKKLQAEKEQLELFLQEERENVQSLKKQLETKSEEKDQAANVALVQLRKERDDLQTQIHSIRNQLEECRGPTVRDLRTTVQQLRNQIALIQTECTDTRHELLITKLEHEKMDVLLASRNKQLSELRGELAGIQTLVTSQLVEFKSGPTSSSPATSQTSMSASQSWQISNIANDSKTDAGETTSKSPIMKQLFVKDDESKPVFRELPSAGHSIISSGLVESVTTPGASNGDQQSKIKELFSDLKRQALSKMNEDTQKADVEPNSSQWSDFSVR